MYIKKKKTFSRYHMIYFGLYEAHA